MDILNFISWIKGKRQVTSVDPTKTLLPVALKDGRRDDEYLTGAISVEDLASQIAPTAVIEAVGNTIYTTTPPTSNVSSSNNIFFGNASGLNTVNNNVGAVIGLGQDTFRESTNLLGNIAIGGSSSYRLAGPSSHSISIGTFTLYESNQVENTLAIGNEAGFRNSQSSNAVFIGNKAGSNSQSNNQSIFIGNQAGQNADGSSSSIYIGVQAGLNSAASNTICLGSAAGIGNQRNSMTIFANGVLPEYANRAAAVANITIASGAVANNTYLYYNQSTFAIEGVRL